MMAIWVMPLPWGPPKSGVMPTSVKDWRSASRFDPQMDAWSISSVVVLLSWVMAMREISKRTSVAKDKRQQIGELRLDMRASLERRMVRYKPLVVNLFLVLKGAVSGGRARTPVSPPSFSKVVAELCSAGRDRARPHTRTAGGGRPYVIIPLLL